MTPLAAVRPTHHLLESLVDPATRQISLESLGKESLTSAVCVDDFAFFENRRKIEPPGSISFALVQHKRYVPALLPYLSDAPDFLKELLGGLGAPRPNSAPWKTKVNGEQEKVSECMIFEWLPDLSDLLVHTFIRAYHGTLGITNKASPEYTQHVSTLLNRPDDGRETHLLVAFDRRKKGLLTSWKVVRSLRRFCREHMPWVAVDTFSHVLLEHRLRGIPLGSRVCIVIVVTPEALSSLDIHMDIHDAALTNTSAMCVYDFQASGNRWKEYTSAPDAVKPQLASSFDVPFLESYGIGPSCLGVVQRMWKGGMAPMGDGETAVKKTKHSSKTTDVHPVVSQYLIVRFGRTGGDWGFNLRAMLLDQAPSALVIADFHGEITDERTLEDMAGHTKVLCVLVDSLAGLQSEAAQLALATAQKTNVRVALLQDARQVYDAQEELGDEARALASVTFYPFARDDTGGSTAHLVAFAKGTDVSLADFQRMLEPLLAIAKENPAAVLST